MLQSRGSGPHGLPNEFLGRTGLWRTQWGQLDGLGTIASSRGSTNVPGRAGLNRPRFPVPSRIHSYFCPFCTAPFRGLTVGGIRLAEPPGPAGVSTVVTWLILPVVICLSQRLSHACLSISNHTVKLRMAH
jgi:hypothetical protein